MNKLLGLCCLVVGGYGLGQQPLQQNFTIRLKDVVRNIPQRCVEHSVTPVSCTNLNSSDALVAHPDDCQLFYYCEPGRAEPTCRQCPASLHFNPTLHVCDWPQNAGCTAQAVTTSRCVEHSVTPVSCTNLNSSDALVAHPDDCQLFYYCEPGRAEPTCRQCPASLHFNPTLHVCDWPQNAGCTAQAATTTTPVSTTALSPNNTTEPPFNSTTSSVNNVTAPTLPSNMTWPWINATILFNNTDTPLIPV